jgi:hypothetical protein
VINIEDLYEEEEKNCEGRGVSIMGSNQNDDGTLSLKK